MLCPLGLLQKVMGCYSENAIPSFKLGGGQAAAQVLEVPTRAACVARS